MAKVHDSWTVLAHGPIEKLTENLWRVEGALPGMPLRRVMTVAKLGTGGLVVHNGIALREEAMAELEAFGKPEVLIVPNGYHRLDAPAWKARFPHLRVLCPRGARKRVEEVIAVDGTYDDLGADDLVSLAHVDGTREREGVMIVRGEGGASLVLNDVLFNMPNLPGFQGFVLRHITASSGGPRISRIARLALLADKKAFRAHLERLADTKGLVRVIVSHHETIDRAPSDVLRSVAASV